MTSCSTSVRRVRAGGNGSGGGLHHSRVDAAHVLGASADTMTEVGDNATTSLCGVGHRREHQQPPRGAGSGRDARRCRSADRDPHRVAVVASSRSRRASVTPSRPSTLCVDGSPRRTSTSMARAGRAKPWRTKLRQVTRDHRDPAGRPSGFAASSESTRELVPRTCVRRGPVPPCASRGSSPATGAPTAPTSGTPRPPSARCPQPHRPPCRVRRTTPCSSWGARSSWPRLSRTRRPGEGVTASVLVWEKRRLADTVVPPQGGSATYAVSYDPRTGSRSARGDDRSDDLRACPAPCRPSRRSGVLGRPSRGRAGCGRRAHGRPQRVPGARYGCPPGKIFVVGRD